MKNFIPLTENQLTTGHYLISKLPEFRVVEFGSRSFYPGKYCQ